MAWTRGRIVGRGSTATVYLAEHGNSDEVFAVKSTELHGSRFLKKEQEILSTVKCPQIVDYRGCDVTFENGVHLFNLFMEYASKGTLADAVRNGNGMEEALVGFYSRQILLGLNYLHSNGIVHCDLKGQNVLLMEHGVKIADFGCARRVEEELVISGSPAFMAPEVARGEEQGFAADVWALGCTVLEMITGKMPWQGVSDPAAVLYRVGFSGDVPEIPNFMSEQGKDFLRKCLKRDPNERWSVVELLGHEFVGKFKESVSDSETPTTVLEGGFWDWDSLETTQEVASTSDCCSSNSSTHSSSPRDRILGLCSNETVWEFDDDDEWITVRSHGQDLEAMSFGKLEEYESDIVLEFGDHEIGLSLIDFYEPKIVVELSTWNIIFDYWCFRSCKCGCYVSDFLSVFQSRKIVFYVIIDSQKKKEIFIIPCFLLCFLFNFSLDR
ncbi:unnamed protein product [Lathyrus sativus]|nr:unnamed protein product [Lathyrus sativus]